ncbi:response regulator [Candidatus Auribacterota bacterium]
MKKNDHGRKRILIVEDSEEMLDIYRMIFKNEAGYEIELEKDAETALRKVKIKSYDLIILDIIMTPMLGDSFFVYVKDDKRTSEIPVLIVSVLDPEGMGRLKSVGRTDFLRKPVTREQLLGKVREMLS